MKTLEKNVLNSEEEKNWDFGRKKSNTLNKRRHNLINQVKKQTKKNGNICKRVIYLP